MERFTYNPSQWVPWKLDKETFKKIRSIKREDIEKHPNPDFKINVVPDNELELMWLADMFYRIKKSSDENQKIVIIFPNPAITYKKLAYLINKFEVNCNNLYAFILDEYADENDNIAPESFPQGFMHQFKNFFYKNIDKKLRPPEKQIIGPTKDNVKDYGKMIEDLGGADACYTGPGWTGHIAFIEPDAPEFMADLEEWKKMGPRIATLSAFTIAQNSLHGNFGMSGDLTLVPPKAFTIGPADIIASKYRMDFHSFNINGTYVSWQRFVSRLCLHGPVTPTVPTSILSTLKTDVLVSETIAQDIKPEWNKGY